MSVIVHYEVSPPDAERFLTALKKFRPATEAAGGRIIATGRLEADPSRFVVLEEWDSHDTMHRASDELGDEFNREAGTEGLEWITKVWTKVDA